MLLNDGNLSYTVHMKESKIKKTLIYTICTICIHGTCVLYSITVCVAYFFSSHIEKRYNYNLLGSKYTKTKHQKARLWVCQAQRNLVFFCNSYCICIQLYSRSSCGLKMTFVQKKGPKQCICTRKTMIIISYVYCPHFDRFRQ